MRRLRPVLLTLLVLAALPGPAFGAASPNVRQVAQIPELAAAISINFIGDTMFVSTVTGLYSYDVSDPAHPARLGAMPHFIWENEDMDVDPVRKRVFISRDPRGFTSPAVSGSTFPYGALEIYDVSDPSVMRLLNFIPLEAGHTTSCVNRCDFVWTAGPGTSTTTQPADWGGRPVFATDVRDPANPVKCPEPIDTARNDGKTDYAHDIQVDAAGVAWVSGAGGVRGYWTEGRHLDPTTGAVREATACSPVPYGGSGTPETATTSRFMHNAWRDWSPAASGEATTPAATATAPSASSAPAPQPAKPAAPRRAKKHAKRRARKHAKHHARRHAKRHAKRRAKRHHRVRPRRRATKRPAIQRATPPALSRNDVLLATEENITDDCKTSGRFVTYDLRGTYGGEGFRPETRKGNRMTVLDTWTPEGQAGSTGCASSHYFTSRGDGITANAFYGQGVRFLDSSDPTDIREVGYWVNDDSDTWAAYWHKGLVYVADFQRGVEILEFKGGPRSRTVRAPVAAPSERRDGLEFAPSSFGGLCPLNVAAKAPAVR